MIWLLLSNFSGCIFLKVFTVTWFHFLLLAWKRFALDCYLLMALAAYLQVRYQSRKRLAEQRPRIRGQFVRQSGQEDQADQDSERWNGLLMQQGVFFEEDLRIRQVFALLITANWFPNPNARVHSSINKNSSVVDSRWTPECYGVERCNCNVWVLSS